MTLYHHAWLFDPLDRLRGLGASVHITRDKDGVKRVVMGFGLGTSRQGREEAGKILLRYEKLLLMQLDVPEGERPRTVQQLIALRRISIPERQYVMRKG